MLLDYMFAIIMIASVFLSCWEFHFLKTNESNYIELLIAKEIVITSLYSYEFPDYLIYFYVFKKDNVKQWK